MKRIILQMPEKRGLLALFILFFLSACAADITTTPTEHTEQQLNTIIAQKLADKPNITEQTEFISQKTISLETPLPKIDPQLVEQLKKEKKQKIKVLVNIEKDEKFDSLKEKVERAGGEVKEAYSIGDIAVIELPADEIEKLSTEQEILQIAPEKEYKAFIQDRIEAYSIPSIWNLSYTGKNIKIAVLDTGITHDALNVQQTASFTNENATDINGHGTHVAGIAHAIAPDAKLYNAKVLNAQGSGTTSQIIAGINWALNPDNNTETDDGADIISMSFGGTFTQLDGPLTSAVREAINKGTIFVAASGNCRQGCGGFYGVTTPGNIKEVITVGAIDDNNNAASFSSGDTFEDYIKPDITAPGVSITSAWLNNGQNTLSGTSMSTPFVSGTIALMLEKEPLTQQEVKQKITATATDRGTTGWDTEYGAGIINPTELNQTTETNQTQNQPIEYLNLEELELINANKNVEVDWITTDCPENLAYSPELNISKEEFITIYEYCLVTSQITETSYGNHTPQIYLPKNATFAENIALIEIQKKNSLKQKATRLNTLNFSTLSEREIIDISATNTVDYDDDYTISGSTNDDGVNWGGSWLQGKLELSYTNIDVVCYDWFTGTTPAYDHCFSTATTAAGRTADFNACAQKSAAVSAVCQAGGCPTHTAEGEHAIPTYSLGFAEKAIITATAHRNCAGTYGISTRTKAHYTLNKRQYSCNNPGGTYKDRGEFGSTTTYWEFASSLSCGTGKGCDENKDDNNADFGTYGTTVPTQPCSTLDTYTCTSHSQCLSGYCTSGHCCQQGEIWTGTQCSLPTTNCSLSNPTWGITGTVSNGTTAGMTVNGNSNCNGQTATFRVYEDDIGTDTLMFTSQPIAFFSGTFQTGWQATWIDDGIGQGDPEYYFTATPSTGSQVQSASNLQVSYPQPTCTDNDLDGWGNPGSSSCPGGLQTDCNDNNAAIHPNAPETCDNTDNNCNSQIDEGGVCCGNTQCDTTKGENPTTCSQDCYSTLLVDSINAPINANQGQQVQVTVNVKNTGTYQGSTNVEIGIIPDYWLTTSTNARNCAANPFFATKTTNAIQPSQTAQVQATLTAPGISSQDTCQTNPQMKSAWDTSHEVIAGLYTTGPYTHRLNKNLQIMDKPCTQQSHCALPAEKCVIPTGQTSGTCQLNACVSTCTNNQYGCSGNTIRHCEDTNNDGCYEWKDVNVCVTGTCTPGQQTCQQTTINTEATIEEAKTGVVWKQINDIVTLNLKYNGHEQISLNYDTNQFQSINCPQTFTITQDKACKFVIKTDVQGAEIGITKQGTTKKANAKIATTTNHNGIIITNKKKLHERYPSQTSVKQLLEEAYSFANNKLIIYDVADYVSTNHPWSIYPSYQETPTNPFMVDNSLSIEIGQLIRLKCDPQTCRSTLILGDDYIIPHYRRYAQFLNSYILYSTTQTNKIYSEIPYIERAQKDLSELDDVLTDDGYGKHIVIIRPDQPSSAMQVSINKLKSVIQLNYTATITEKTSSQIYCNDNTLFNTLNDKTIIVIGTEQNNNAFNCMPFVAGLENRDTAFLEVNPWDGNEYSIIINTEDSNVVSAFSDSIRTKAYKKIIGRQWYYIETTITVLGFASLACDPFGISCDTIIDAADATVQCGVKQDALLCGTTTTSLATPYIPNAPVKIAIKSFTNYAGPPASKFLAKYGTAGFAFLAKNLDKIDDFKTYLKKAADHFGNEWDNIIKTTTKTPEDEYAISLGTKKILGHVSSLNDIKMLKGVKPSNEVLADGLKSLGKIDSVPGSNVLAKRIADQDNPGPIFEAKRAAELFEQPATKIINLGQDLSQYGITGEADIIYEVTRNGQTAKIMEEVKWKQNGLLRKSDIEVQVNKYVQIKQHFNEIRIVTNGNVEASAKLWAESQGIKVIPYGVS